MKVTITVSPVSFVAGCLVTALVFQTFRADSEKIPVVAATPQPVQPNQVAMSDEWLLTDSLFKPGESTPVYRQPDPLPSPPNAMPIDGSHDDIEELLKSIPPDEKLMNQPPNLATPDELSKILSKQDDVTKEVFGETLQDLTAEQAAELMNIRAQVEGP